MRPGGTTRTRRSSISNKEPTSAINEQVFDLWSLQEMIYLSKIRAKTGPWEQAMLAALNAVREKLWDRSTQRYWDLDTKRGNSGLKEKIWMPTISSTSRPIRSHRGHDTAAGCPRNSTALCCRR